MNLVEEAIKSLGQETKPDTNMNTFQASFDCSTITLNAKDKTDAIKLLHESDLGVTTHIKGDKIFVEWSNENDLEEIYIELIPRTRGIIQYESH